MELRKCIPRHRRSVSDPTELMPSLRLALAGEGKRQRSPSSRSPFADGPRKQKSAFDVIEDASMFEDVGPGELFEEFGDYAFGTAAGTAVDGARPSSPGAESDDRRSPLSEAYDGFDSDPEYDEGRTTRTRGRRPVAARGASIVPMWTVEEDLLILKMVEEHGKRWSKIAAQLPGRTDNGVRNRFNRMEKAQELKSTRRADAGYRCRRCGQPKRGHICAALTQGAGPRTAEELEEKAAALTALSAAKIPAFAEQQAAARPRSISEPIPELLVPSYEGDGAPVVAVADVLGAAADGADEEAPLSEEEEEELAQFVRDSPELIERVLDPAVLGADAPAVAGGGLSGSFDPFDEGKLDAVLHELNVSLGGNPPPLLSRLGSLGLEDGAVEFGSLGDLSFRSEQQAAAPTATPTPSPATPLSAQESRPTPVAITTYAPVLSVS